MHSQSIHNALTKALTTFPRGAQRFLFTLPPRALRPEPPGPYPSPSLQSPASQNAEQKKRRREEEEKKRTLIPPPRSVSESLPFPREPERGEEKKKRRREEEEKKKHTNLTPQVPFQFSPSDSHHASCRAFPGWGRMRLNPPTSNL